MLLLNLRCYSGTFRKSTSFFWRVFHELFGGFYFWVNRSSAVFYRFKCVATVSRIILFFFFFAMIIQLKKGVSFFFFLTPFPCLIFTDLIQSIKDLLNSFVQFRTGKVSIMPLL